MSMLETSAETLQQIKEAQKNPLDLTRAGEGFTAPTVATQGFQLYDLEMGAKMLYPVLTPLRNQIPRVSGKGGQQANWKAITGINVAAIRGLVGEANRGGAIKHTLVEYLAAYRGMGLENFVTFEANLAAAGFDDARAKAVLMLLQSMMIEEERLILGGNTSVALGTTPTPTLADVATGGTLNAATAYKVGCIALTFEGWKYNSVAATGGALVPVVTKTNTDGSTDTFNGGTAKRSAVASQTTANDGNNTHCVSASVTPVKGAYAYAWYLGTVNDAGTKLNCITTLNSVVLSAASDAGAQAYDVAALDADKSRNAMAFDGLLAQLCVADCGAYYAALPTGTAGVGTKLTSDGAGGITQFNTAFKYFWDNYKLGPDKMYISGQQLLDINAIVVANGGAPLIRFNMDNGGTPVIEAGVVVGSFLNPYTNTKVQVIVHPDMPSGTVMFYSNGVPYPLANINNILQMKMRQDYYQIEWPLRTRKYEFGVYADGVLQNYFPPAFGVITNIAPGH